MDLLKREFAPILPDAWKLIDEEATRVLKINLGGRKLVDVDGPHGWGLAAVNTGRLELIDERPVEGVHVGLRRVQPVVELRSPIHLDQMELDTVARGAVDPDLSAVIRVAEAVARAEDGAIFHGFARAGIVGIVAASPHRPCEAAAAADMPRVIVEAQETLRRAGIDGPYALALGSHAYEQVYAATEEGYPIAKHIERVLMDGPIVRAPAVDGAVVMSVRGGDYQLTLGQDLSIGYAHHDKHAVELYLCESFTFRVLEPRAAVHLRTN